ncbi:MAG: hypothetical protein WBX17_12465, partial [Microbacterium sp.]
MTIEWGDYQPLDLPFPGPPKSLKRSEARANFDLWTSASAEREGYLQHLLELNGRKLVRTDRGVAELNDWFAGNVEPDDLRPGAPSPRWFWVATDVANFLGNYVISTCPN